MEKLKPHLHELPDLKWLICWDDELDEENSISLEALENRGAETLAASPGVIGDVENKIQPDDIAIIIYTSGTTGPPKGACLSHKNVLAQVTLTGQLITDDQLGNIMMFFLPLAHVGERVSGQFMRIQRGITAAYVDDITRILDDLEGYGQTETSCFCTLCSPDAYRFGSVGRTLPGVELKTADEPSND
ncbi:MAG: AMP-binding protein [Proteobacteria bacterium]|nr:AMP-binding protein [Pseudomonadota bacterium]